MRRILVAALAVSALALSACGSDAEGEPADGATPAATAPAAEDAAASATACAEAVAISKTGAESFESGVDDLLKVALEGDEAKVEAAEKEFRATLTGWSAKLTELAAQPVAADVKTALTEGAATVTKIADPNDNTPVNAAKEELTGVADQIGAACA